MTVQYTMKLGSGTLQLLVCSLFRQKVFVYHYDLDEDQTPFYQQNSKGASLEGCLTLDFGTIMNENNVLEHISAYFRAQTGADSLNDALKS